MGVNRLKEEEFVKVGPLADRLQELVNSSREVSTGLFPEDFMDPVVENVDSIRFKATNPDEIYSFFYDRIQSTLLKLLPKDASIRKPILEMKTILLTGKKKINGKRGADSRGRYIHEYERVVEIIESWVSSSTNPLDLYESFRQKNIELGYIEEDDIILS